MSFSENEYFTNEEIKFVALQDESDTGQTVEVIGTIIEWKTGKDPTRKQIKKTQKNKKTGETRVILKYVACDSFFNVFESKKEPDEPENQNDDDDIDSEDAKVMEQL